MKEELKKAKYILWIDYGYEGWKPNIFLTLEEAVAHTNYGNDFVITRGALDYKVTEVEEQ